VRTNKQVIQIFCNQKLPPKHTALTGDIYKNAVQDCIQSRA